MPDSSEQPPVDAQLVQQVARLARLQLDPDELVRTAEELGRILGHFRAIQQVDTDGVDPLTHVLAGHGQPANDQARPFDDARARLTTLTAHAREGFFVVPRVLDDEGAPQDADPDTQGGDREDAAAHTDGDHGPEAPDDPSAEEEP